MEQLLPLKKYTLLPVSKSDQAFYDLFIEMHRIHWSFEELDFAKDRHDYETMNPDLAKIFEAILAFFAATDSIVAENVLVNFMTKAETLCVSMAYAAQIYFEQIHVVTYARAIDVYITDEHKKYELTSSFQHDPKIMKRDLWIKKHMDTIAENEESVKTVEAERLVAYLCTEGIFFVSAFIFIFFLRSKGLMPMFARANELIARDENLHVKLGIVRYNAFYRNILTNEKVKEIIEEAVELELEFAKSLLEDKDHIDTLYLTDIVGHIYNLGNNIALSLGLREIWKVDKSKLPPWLNFQILPNKQNFYEGPVTNYAIGAANGEEDDDF
jgi:ribonucleoside-diphosphate reductase beta chain